MENSAPLGERIAYHRRRRGLSQVKLAGLVARSESWLSQVERGVRSIDRLSVLAQLASALNIPVTELAPDTLPDVGDQEEPAVRALRTTLVDYHVIDTLLHQAGAPVVATVDAVELRGQVDAAWEHVHASRFTPLADVAPGLIAQAEQHARAVSEDGRRAALELVAEAYLVSASVLAKLRETDMAWVAGDRAVLAAVRAQRPLLAAASAFRIGHAFLSGGRPEDAQRVAQSAAAALATNLDGAPVEHVALWGALNLVVAIAATRRADSAAAIGAMRNAEQAAQRVGQDRNDFHTEFGPTNVALHAVAVSVELGDAGEALRRAATVDASLLSSERRARFLIDVARAYGQRRKAGDAVRALLEAEALTPEQVRTHGLVRELVRDLLRGQRRQVDSQLRGLARRIGVLPP